MRILKRFFYGLFAGVISLAAFFQRKPKESNSMIKKANELSQKEKNKALRTFIMGTVLFFSLSFSTDTDITYQAMNKAIQTQVKYETLEQFRVTEKKELQNEISSLKFENLIKDILLVVLATIKITN